jgi:maltose O-acetyltransferase
MVLFFKKGTMKKVIIRFFAYLFDLLNRAYHNYTYQNYRKKYSLSDDFYFNGDGILMYGEGKISIANGSYIGRYSRIQASKDYSVTIGKNCRIGPFFQVWTQTSNVDSDFSEPSKVITKFGDIIIGDAVWIGTSVVISPGVKVGNNSIIGANSVVTRDVPDFAIVGGVPAKLIRYKKRNN